MFPAGAASLVTASDFNQSFKASVSVGDFSSSEIAICGTRTTPGEISGVVSTVPYFLPQEFYYVDPADREYVCVELSAFLVYFISELGCKKLNPPSTRRLSGLGMHRLEWLKAAEKCGVPVWPFHMKNGVGDPVGDPKELKHVASTIVGDSLVEDGAPEIIGRHMRTLSRHFAMPYLSCLFVSREGGDYFLVELASVPDVSVPANREAIVRFME